MSGFTGSAGYAVVTLDKAALWTDGRYFLQAEKQLDASLWTLMKSGQEGVVEKEVWLCDVLPLNSRVGMDPHLITIDQAKTLRTALQARGHTLVATHGENLVDQVWAKDRPMRPQNPVVSLALKYAGQSHVEKLSNLQQFLKDYGATKPATPTLTRSTDAIHGGSGAAGIVVCALDEIAWLFNLRGSDIRYNPVFFAYAIVTTTETFLYVDSRKLNDDVVEHLAAANVHVRPYLDFYVDLASARKTLHLSKEGKVGFLAELICLNDRNSCTLQHATLPSKKHWETQESRRPMMLKIYWNRLPCRQLWPQSPLRMPRSWKGSASVTCVMALLWYFSMTEPRQFS